jgi:hypothetical protein
MGNTSYGYADMNPIKLVDPLGLSAQCARSAAGEFIRCFGLGYGIWLGVVEGGAALACGLTGPAAAACYAGLHESLLLATDIQLVNTFVMCGLAYRKAYNACEACRK